MGNNHYVHVNGIRLHYVDYAGEGETLILSHGLTANAHSFDGLVKAGLCPALHVMALDLRGRGETDKPDDGYTMADHARDVIGLLDLLEIEQVILGGHSFGGLLTYYVAAHYPERVKKCVVLDAPAAVDLNIREQIKPSLSRLGLVIPSWDAYLERVKSMPYFVGWEWDPTIEDYYRADVFTNPDGTVQARPHAEHIEKAVEGAATTDWDSIVRKVVQPTLLLRATEPFGPAGSPPILPAHLAQATLEKLPKGTTADIHGNHLTFLFGAAAKHTTQAILDFVMAT